MIFPTIQKMTAHRFHSLEVAESRIDGCRMGWVTVKSPSLKGRGDICVALPEGAEDLTALPVITLLHGIYGSHWAWSIKGKAHWVQRQMVDAGTIAPAILVMPSDGLWGDGSGYVKHEDSGKDFESWITRDAFDAVSAGWPEIDISGPRFLAGLSMGGFGALRIGASHPEIYSGISGHSSVTHLDQLKERCQSPQLDGSRVSAGERSLIEVMRRQAGSLPPLRFDCGTEDVLIEPNRQLHRELEELGIPHDYQEFGGEHTWDYWEEHLKDSLEFFHRLAVTRH